jgi:hypothetical protein
VTRYSPRVLDASALVQMFQGHPLLMQLLDDAEQSNVVILVPTLAIAEAEAVMGAGMRMWEHFLALRGLRAMELTEHTAIETGRLASDGLRVGGDQPLLGGQLMTAQVVWEAQTMTAPIITQYPALYARRDVAVMPLP